MQYAKRWTGILHNGVGLVMILRTSWLKYFLSSCYTIYAITHYIGTRSDLCTRFNLHCLVCSWLLKALLPINSAQRSVRALRFPRALAPWHYSNTWESLPYISGLHLNTWLHFTLSFSLKKKKKRKGIWFTHKRRGLWGKEERTALTSHKMS